MKHKQQIDQARSSYKAALLKRLTPFLRPMLLRVRRDLRQHRRDNPDFNTRDALDYLDGDDRFTAIPSVAAIIKNTIDDVMIDLKVSYEEAVAGKAVLLKKIIDELSRKVEPKIYDRIITYFTASAK